MADIPKANCVIADNWSFQTVAHALSEGLEMGEASLIRIDQEAGSHEFSDVPAGAFAIEAVFDLIADIVLREQIWVDEAFRTSWEGKHPGLDQLVAEGVVVPFRFLGQAQELDEPRRFYTSKLCVTESLKQAQRENEEGWKRERKTPHPYLSQIVWGGAGMLARSLVYRHAYTPFPARRHLMIASGVAWAPDAARNLRDLVTEKQARMSVLEGTGARVTQLKVNGAEIAALAIRESSTPKDLLEVALQLRAEYAELREWITNYQKALEEDDARTLGKCEGLLRSVSSFVDARLGRRTSSGPTFTLGWGVMQAALQGNPLDSVLNRFGVRAQINKLMFEQGSKQDLTKLLGIFGQRTSRNGLQIAEYFQVR